MSQQILKAVESPDSISSLLVGLADNVLLLPMSAVAEVVRQVQIQGAETKPEWMYGWLSWRDRQLPLISFEAITGGEKPAVPERPHALILNSLDGELPFYAVLLQQFPSQVSIAEDGELKALPSADKKSKKSEMLMQVVLGEKNAVIPNLEEIERLCLQGIKKSNK